MDRRNFIKVVGAGSVAMMALPSVAGLMDCPDSDGLRPSLNQTDIRKMLLSYAMQAPNPHNIQAWKVAFIGEDTIRLLVDETRLLPETDPIYRQIHVGQGCFLENLTIAATRFKLRADITYFPLGEYDNQSLEDLPIADIRLIPDENVTLHPLFHYLTTRQTTKRAYSAEGVSRSHLDVISSAVATEGFELGIVDGEKRMEDYLIKAVETEESDPNRTLETIDMFRFNDEEYEQYRDGFGLAQNGITGFKRFIAESFFVSRESATKDTASFGQEAVETAQRLVRDNPYYALLISHNNDRLSQVKAGRFHCRINLTARSLGLAVHPMSQILQEYPDMSQLQANFKQTYGVAEAHTVQMLFRIGKADPLPPTPRREVNDILFGS